MADCASGPRYGSVRASAATFWPTLSRAVHIIGSHTLSERREYGVVRVMSSAAARGRAQDRRSRRGDRGPVPRSLGMFAAAAQQRVGAEDDHEPTAAGAGHRAGRDITGHTDDGGDDRYGGDQ